ncbi:MAG: aldo/keto reductase [Thermoplasmata archaeon]|nr:aldo/keto reductase [Thermoplasmata archaeon]
MDLAPGQATPDGTRRFRDRAVEDEGVSPAHFRTAPVRLELTSLGLGTYIGEPDAATDSAVEAAVARCLSSRRINVLDTAINYRYQRAERSVGRALAAAVGSGRVARDEVFVATKSGYFAPDAESGVAPDRWVESELVEKGVLDVADIVDGCHAMSVGYLRDQFERSRRNLGLATLDLLYLHNAPDAQLAVVGREEFERRLRSAFELYEGYRDAGVLGAYGLATWDCLRAKRTDPGYLAVQDALRIAREVGGEDHGLRFLQFPFNVGMPEAAVERNQVVGGTRLTLFDAARALGLGCFTSVPLLQGQLARRGIAAPDLTPAQTAIQFARSAPGTLAALVGQKRAEHLDENLSVASRPPWTEAEFDKLL